MPTIYLVMPGARAGLESEHIRLDLPGDDDRPASQRDIPLLDVERVIVDTRVTFSMPLLAECMRREIPVVLTHRGERVVGLCQPPAPHTRARRRQYERMRESAFVLAVAAGFVRAKLANSRRVLQRLAANRPDREADAAMGALRRLIEDVAGAESVETLRGLEGTGAGRYFEALGRFFPATAPFEYRSRRPPHNAANAVLSFAYTLLAAEAECAAHAAGLDVAQGFLHEAADRRPSLALDLIEPFRAPLADALALDLLNHATIDPVKHFQPVDGGVYLNDDGRRRFFVVYERRMQSEFVSPATGRRTSLRTELQHSAVALRMHIMEDASFEAFAMH